jgi:hypothetical protein
MAPTGTETGKVDVDGDPKAGLTLMGTITVAGTKLPLFLVAKGLTNNLVTPSIRLMTTTSCRPGDSALGGGANSICI